MNFQAVEQGKGDLIQMFGVFTNIGGLQYTPQQKAKAICKIRDDTNVEHNVHIYQGKGQLPSSQQLNQRCQFNLSTFQGSYKNTPYTGYSGFWNSEAQANQPAPQQGQQAPSQARQPAKAKEDVDWDAKDLRNARMNGLNNATQLVCLLAELNKETVGLNAGTIKSVAAELVNYIYDGLKKQGSQTSAEQFEEKYNFNDDGSSPPTDDY